MEREQYHVPKKLTSDLMEPVMPRSSATGPVPLILAAAVLVGASVFILKSGRSEKVVSTVGTAKPSHEDLNRAIELGTQAFIRDYIRTSYDAVSNGGWVDYTDALDETKRYGPNVFVACQLYLLTHLLMYDEEFNVPADDPLLTGVEAWFLDQFDEDKS